MRVVAGGSVHQGRLELTDRPALAEALAKFKDGPVTVTFERRRSTRSTLQNAYLWSVVVPYVSKSTGFDLAETHEVLKAQHLPKDQAAMGENGRLMNGLVIGGSTTRLSTWEYVEFLDRIVQWAAETLSCVIPPPDPAWRQHAQDAREKADAERKARQALALAVLDRD